MNPAIWTPKYLLNRTRLFFYEKLNRNEPWIPSKAVRALDKVLHNAMNGIEFGSGRSTVWYAQRIGNLVSVEDHSEWYKKVNIQLEDAKVSNVTYVLKSSKEDVQGCTEYVRVIQEFEDESLDFVVVDGKHRDSIANAVINKLVSGGILLLDDSERYLAYNSNAPYAIGGEVSKMTTTWKLFYDTVLSWDRSIYTNGVTDTTIFIKP